MANPRAVLLLRTLLYLLLIALSFCIVIGITVMNTSVNSAHSNTTTTSSTTATTAASASAHVCILDDKNAASWKCDFPIVVAIIWQFIFLLFRVVTLGLLACGTMKHGSPVFGVVMRKIYVIFEFFGFLFTFFGTIILATTGTEWAKMTCNKDDKHASAAAAASSSPYHHCDDEDGNDNGGDYDVINVAYKTAQVASAVSIFLWILVFAEGAVSLCADRRLPVFVRTEASGGGDGGQEEGEEAEEGGGHHRHQQQHLTMNPNDVLFRELAY